MVRLWVVGLVLVLIAEIAAALFFCLGYFWLGGLVPGVLLAVAFVVLFFVLPLTGEVVVEFDSLAKELKVRLSWWGRVRMRLSGRREARVRILGIPLCLKARAPAPPPPQVNLRRWLQANVKDVVRLGLAGLEAAAEMACESRALVVTVNAPAEIDVLDQIIAGVVGHREWPPLDVRVLPEGKRRVRLRYRLPLRTAAAAGLYVLVQGRAVRVMRSLARARKQAKAAGSPPAA